jgi:hypothetical protein
MVRNTSKCPETHKLLWSKAFDFVAKYFSNTKNLTIVIVNIHKRMNVYDWFRLPWKHSCADLMLAVPWCTLTVRVRFLNMQKYFLYIHAWKFVVMIEQWDSFAVVLSTIAKRKFPYLTATLIYNWDLVCILRCYCF